MARSPPTTATPSACWTAPTYVTSLVATDRHGFPAIRDASPEIRVTASERRSPGIDAQPVLRPTSAVTATSAPMTARPTAKLRRGRARGATAVRLS